MVPATAVDRGVMIRAGRVFFSAVFAETPEIVLCTKTQQGISTRRSGEADLGRGGVSLVGWAFSQDRQELNSNACSESSVLGCQIPASCPKHRLSDLLRLL